LEAIRRIFNNENTQESHFVETSTMHRTCRVAPNGLIRLLTLFLIIRELDAPNRSFLHTNKYFEIEP